MGCYVLNEASLVMVMVGSSSTVHATHADVFEVN